MPNSIGPSRLHVAEKEASLLQIEMVNGDITITAGGVDLSASANPTVALIGSAINAADRIDLQLTSADLSAQGGAVTQSAGSPSDPSLLRIKINPQQVRQTVVSGIVAAGPLMGMNLGLTYSTATALVHEFGHAYGYYAEGASRFPVFGQTNATAIRYENLHRALMADPRGPLLNQYPVKRTRH